MYVYSVLCLIQPILVQFSSFSSHPLQLTCLDFICDVTYSTTIVINNSIIIITSLSQSSSDHSMTLPARCCARTVSFVFSLNLLRRYLLRHHRSGVIN